MTMNEDRVCFAGEAKLVFPPPDVKGRFVEREGEAYYVIEGIQDMDPFFMSIVSSSDHWMFISSNGSLTAGRKRPEIALFPYYTADKIQDSAGITGPRTIIRLKRGERWRLWDPFSDLQSGIYRIARNVYKNIAGNKIIFEEINQDLEMTFAYQWCNSENFGFVRKSILTNLSAGGVSVELLDGIQNILPQGVDRMMQSDKSCLVDAYKRCELTENTGVGIYMLSSIPVDRAEPSESLRANTVWSLGNDIRRRLLSSSQVGTFRRGKQVHGERDVVGKRGAYFVNIETELEPRGVREWRLVAEVDQNAAKLAGLNKRIRSDAGLAGEIESDVAEGTLRLTRMVASADGLQLTSDERAMARHFANVLFNLMRGGIFEDGYAVSRNDLTEFALKANSSIYNRNESWFRNLPTSIQYGDLIACAQATGQSGLLRTCLEYMPLTFGRRHGDPSRPWNVFSIDIRNEDGSRVLNYQGNWRDIFQNWEALALSFPDYIESMISKFVNASTADGYNPYRVTRDGFEWEIQNPDDPWSFIGYWGDHQTIYLLKLLELSERFHPGRIQQLLVEDLFSYANVPYRIKDYRSVLQDPYHSISYDKELEGLIASRVRERGSDGKLIWNREGEVYLVNLAEKLLVSILSKMANFVPEGGIWMNTQRPEWNDANNALAGYGLSMVTLCYLRRLVEFCKSIFNNPSLKSIPISEEVAQLLESIRSILRSHRSILTLGLDNKSRRAVLDELGAAATAYREKIYSGAFSEKKRAVPIKNILGFFSVTLEYMDQTIRANRRPDQLYHSYNLLSVPGAGELEVAPLYEMLEGQVAVLSSGYLSVSESIEVLEALRKSAMFREDQYSYILYPARTLPGFAEKNNLPRESAEKSALIQKLAACGNTLLVEKDVNGAFHFNGALTNKNVLSGVLDKLSKQGYEELVARDRQRIFEIYESMFRHKEFTGRSGTFFSYEGLGSIYWHMVSKLLLAVEEVLCRAVDSGRNRSAINRLREIYYDIRKGLGTEKTPAEYGAFPTDPYSHTPAHSGAQQPGMTGQVKEDIITRNRELGLIVSDGAIQFESSLLRPEEFLREPARFRYFDLKGCPKTLDLEPGSLAFTVCQVPVVLKRGDSNFLRLASQGGSVKIEGLKLDKEMSRSIFERRGEIQLIEVELKAAGQ